MTTISRAAEWKATFETVVNCYVQLRAYPAISAKDYDPTSNRRATSWSPDIAHFLVDCERITEEALGGDIALEAAWMSLAAGESVPASVAREVYRRCGKAYLVLKPGRYFSRALRADGWMTVDGDA